MMYCDIPSATAINERQEESDESQYLNFWLRRNAERGEEIISDFGFPILCQPGVFCPSPQMTNSTSIMIRNLPRLYGQRILDIGTGTGILAIAAVRAGADSVDAIDIDQKAVILAKRKAVTNGFEGKIHCEIGDMFLNNGKKYDGIMANLPLIGKAWNTDNAAIADLWKCLFANAKSRLTPGGWLRFTLASFADEAEILSIMRHYDIKAQPIAKENKFGMDWSVYDYSN